MHTRLLRRLLGAVPASALNKGQEVVDAINAGDLGEGDPAEELSGEVSPAAVLPPGAPAAVQLKQLESLF